MLPVPNEILFDFVCYGDSHFTISGVPSLNLVVHPGSSWVIAERGIFLGMAEVSATVIV